MINKTKTNKNNLLHITYTDILTNKMFVLSFIICCF